MRMLRLYDDEFWRLRDIYKKQQRYHYNLGSPNKDIFLRDSIDSFRKYMVAEKGYICLVIEDDSSTIIAFVACTYDEYDAYIEDIYVVESVRYQGLGSRLLRALICELSSLGYDNIAVHITRGNEGVFKFYESLEFYYDSDDENGYYFKRRA